MKDSFGVDVGDAVGEPVSLPDAAALAELNPYQFQWWALGLVGARPVVEKKGPDQGIDGRLYFHDEPGPSPRTKQVVFSVKSGSTGVKDVRDLRGVLEREKAAIGVLITLHRPTQPCVQRPRRPDFTDRRAGRRNTRGCRSSPSKACSMAGASTIRRPNKSMSRTREPH
ncbi:restriction endonuclease [Pendulispora albinea]|uniref:Restriction endonuclease n=2 Tax=Pendulispora albinea TaxID=2741071 RepID=A0ABZ2MCL5_9BACT